MGGLIDFVYKVPYRTGTGTELSNILSDLAKPLLSSKKLANTVLVLKLGVYIQTNYRFVQIFVYLPILGSAKQGITTFFV